MLEKVFLPIGSIVLLKNGDKKVMVTGFCTTPNDNKNKIYDYSGCVYPEGVINSNEVCLFNNNQIAQVLFKGYENDEEIAFKKKLIDIITNNVKIDNEHNIINDSNEGSNGEFSVNNGAF